MFKIWEYLSGGFKALGLGYASICKSASTLSICPKIPDIDEIEDIDKEKNRVEKRLETDPSKLFNQVWEDVGKCMWEAVDKVVPKEIQEKVKEDMEKEQ